MSVSINGTGGITFADASTQSTGGYTGFRNRIINGAMVIDQRNAGASGTAQNVYTVDRWFYNASQASKGTWQQNAGAVTPPDGFKNYLSFTSSLSYSVGATDYFGFYQSIEGFNVADFGWGTSNAQPVTLSFMVYSSLTGTFGGSINNSGFSRNYPFTYTVSSANTWTPVSVTIPGDTSGTWLSTNGIGATVNFSLGTGSTYSGTAGSWSGSLFLSVTGATSVVGTAGATFYITGVQLEKGSVATPFEFRQYGQELALCQRYYWRTTAFGASTASWASGVVYSTGTNARLHMMFPVPMRAAPTVSKTGTLYCATGGGFYAISGFASQWATATSALLDTTIAAGSTVGSGAVGYGRGTATDYVELTGAEL